MTPQTLDPVPTTSFVTELVKERQDLQRLLRQQLQLLGEDLLFIAEEYSAFQGSSRRIDLLALDRAGQLVVIELKRTDDGGHMELQALRYAAMVSTMTFDQLVATFAAHNDVPEPEARQRIDDFLGWEDADEEEPATLAQTVRIVLVSADFSPEVTSTVLWLNQNYGLDVRCVRLVPYKLDGQLLVDIQQLIPLPEAQDFQIKQRDKNVESAAARARASTKDYTKYDLEVGGAELAGLSKQAAVRAVVQHLLERGVPGAVLRSTLTPRRWHAVQPEEAESVEDAFRRQYPGRGTHYWFDLGMSDEQGSWVMPRIGGTKTEGYLDALVAVAGDDVPVRWSRAGG
jgi:endonuclease NucS-like protein